MPVQVWIEIAQNPEQDTNDLRPGIWEQSSSDDMQDCSLPSGKSKSDSMGISALLFCSRSSFSRNSVTCSITLPLVSFRQGVSRPPEETTSEETTYETGEGTGSGVDSDGGEASEQPELDA